MSMPAPQNLRSTGERIELLLDQLQSNSDSGCFDLASEILSLVSELYGAGLSRVVELAQERSPEFVTILTEDELVASLMLVHGLHPDTLEARVQGALEKVRPLLGAHAGDVELLDIDPGAGAVRIRLLGSCDGCPSSSVTLQLAVERAITEAAPEIVIIDVDEPSATEPTPIPVIMRAKPGYEECPAEVAAGT
ncbi:MAG: NifU family protein [Acidimicrobiales bacterium]|jgi:Fe-S cluster biogenesis protein NfuA